MAQLINQFINKNITNESQLLYRAAHDIESPLCALQICLDVIKEIAPSETLGIMNTAIKRIRAISRNLIPQENLAVSQPINLVEVMQQILAEKNIEWLYLPCSIEINMGLDAKKYFIYAEQLGICRMLSNLLNNAYESMSEQPRIIISFKSTKSFIILGIQDFGCGIKKNKIDLIRNGYSTKKTGYGLGLSNAVQYMLSLKGKLKIQSTPGVGTHVELFFPQ